MQKNQDIPKAYIQCIPNCTVWREFYSENIKPNWMKLGDFLYGVWKSVEWKLILMNNFVFAGKNYYKLLIDEAHLATAHGGVKNTMQYLIDRYQLQSLSALVQSLVASCDTCQRVKQSNKPPLRLVTTLHVPVSPWNHISMDYLQLTPIFIPCSTMYPNIEIDNDHMLYIRRIWTIDDRHRAYKFPVPIPDNFKAEQCTRTYEGHVFPYIGYSNTIVFDRDSLIMSAHFQA